MSVVLIKVLVFWIIKTNHSVNHALRLKVCGALWCVPAGFMSREATSVDSDSTSPDGPAGCGARWMA
ncbi:MAG: hypothetical protein ISS66_10235 [Desulfobacteraceae bacterium]|nr:hypothetical protein [Desulfobacteraceae bacterium]